LAAECIGPAEHLPGRKAAEVVDYPRLAGPVLDRRAALAALPPLLRTYLGMGGWVSDHAVVDRELDTLHVFTCVEVDRVPPARAASLRAVAGTGRLPD
jgi:putative hemolysin